MTVKLLRERQIGKRIASGLLQTAKQSSIKQVIDFHRHKTFIPAKRMWITHWPAYLQCKRLAYKWHVILLRKTKISKLHSGEDDESKAPTQFCLLWCSTIKRDICESLATKLSEKVTYNHAGTYRLVEITFVSLKTVRNLTFWHSREQKECSCN